MLLVHGANGKIILYKPGGDKTFHEFDDKQQLNNWVLEQAGDSHKRAELASHFSLDLFGNSDLSNFHVINCCNQIKS
ncbi:dermonecrotic toxin domain-containing protein [Candidatus Fukatsuia endosymbiont of Tuberolachnus salignus]|uniref:Dermonecrotic toxin N-terminal domain-containing protein n=1 Tax=Candidatus Fukatsuia symbiotica TaxID=1878942 RepID=A0A2U8I3Q0_9GAMM|nr:hypothetical protein CCS41_03535 [Candidatus Fukatsuia symbiotica]